ncbi:ATP-binding protein [Dactylosporangium siamense]|uniref:Tetratricopeptide repeat protein n=1 Tax=Dactylosporangium siamense TaxID=685454 RepID=A0A919UDK9_9ACTN|nr:ATP-binding protein [Dactylosporangium siamense]GIG48026.1 hypothetical protein Dsi01nite_060670 [Dactylosporangium siamense]
MIGARIRLALGFLIVASAGWLAVGGAYSALIVGGLGAVAAFAPDVVARLDKRADDKRERRARRQELADAADAVADPVFLGIATSWLRAERAVIPFAGRDREIDDLVAWCADGSADPVRLVVGAGGTGKTRLAAELAARMKTSGWSTHTVGTDKEHGALKAVRAATSRPVLLIVDYAETRTGLAGLLADVGGLPAEQRRQCRVVLLARDVGEWWERLRFSAHLPTSELVRRVAPQRLAHALAPDLSPDDLVTQAVSHFATALRVPAPAEWSVQRSDAAAPVLVLHAAALLVVLRERDRQAGPGDPQRTEVRAERVLSELLLHEGRLWAGSRPARLRDVPVRGWLRAVAFASLVAPETEDQAVELLARVPELTEPADVRRDAAWWLRQLYPPVGDGRWWGGVTPDLLAEHLVCEVFRGAPWLAKAYLAGLPERDAARAMLVLARADEHHPIARTAMKAALRADFAGLSVAAAVAGARGGRLPEILASVTAGITAAPADFVRLVDAIPFPTTVLAQAYLAAVTRARDGLPPASSVPVKAVWNDLMGLALNQTGRPADAVHPTAQAVEDYRRLVAAEPDVYRPDLARALSNLGARLSAGWRHTEAYAATEEAAGLYRQLMRDDPREYRHELARCLSNLVIIDIRQQRSEQCLPQAEEAVGLYRELVAADARPHAAGLGHALASLASARAAANQDGPAVSAFAESVEIYRALAADDPDKYPRPLFETLLGLARTLVKLGRSGDALSTAREAVAAYQRIPFLHRASFDHAQAELLLLISQLVAADGDPADIAATMQEAAVAYVHLAERMPNRFGTGAMRIMPPDPDAVDPHRHLRWLVRQLVEVGTRLQVLGCPADATAAFSNAIEISRSIVEHRMRRGAAPPPRHADHITESRGLRAGLRSVMDSGPDDLWLSLHLWLADAYSPRYPAALASSMGILATHLVDRGIEPRGTAIRERADLLAEALRQAFPAT